jgi:hypothetical protein
MEDEDTLGDQVKDGLISKAGRVYTAYAMK